MRIGIITFHRADNYGAVLQCFALYKYLQSRKHDVEIIDYLPNNQVPNRNRYIQSIYHVGRWLYDICFNRALVIRRKKFNKFRMRMNMSSQTYYGDLDIYKAPPQYDFLISGSDQIFNTTLSGKSKAYYLGFDKKTPKISYASSFGRSSISDFEIDLIKEELPNFRRISVREKNAIDIIRSLTEVEPEWVLDPVFLLNKEEWTRELDLSNQLSTSSSKYILVYLMEISSGIIKTIIEIKKLTGFNVILLNGSGERVDTIIFDKLGKECGPVEFLRLINNAEFIITNSYHGAAFSILFEKEFCCISHSTRNDRLISLMELCETLERLIPYSSDEISITNSIICGREANSKLAKMIDKSKQFLNEEIEKL